jgi:hypothetical protein
MERVTRKVGQDKLSGLRAEVRGESESNSGKVQSGLAPLFFDATM